MFRAIKENLTLVMTWTGIKNLFITYNTSLKNPLKITFFSLFPTIASPAGRLFASTLLDFGKTKTGLLVDQWETSRLFVTSIRTTLRSNQLCTDRLLTDRRSQTDLSKITCQVQGGGGRGELLERYNSWAFDWPSKVIKAVEFHQDDIYHSNIISSSFCV